VVKLSIVIKDKKDKLGIDLECIYEFDLCYDSSYEIPPYTLAEQAGFAVLRQAVAICKETIKGVNKNEN